MITDEARLDELAHLFDELRLKLPSELTTGEDAIDLQSHDTPREAVQDARELPLAVLLGDGAGPVSCSPSPAAPTGASATDRSGPT